MPQTRLADLSDKAMPQSIIAATKSREIGLGCRAVSNSVDIARIQAERQREANGLLKEIKGILMKASPTSSSGEWVFS